MRSGEWSCAFWCSVVMLSGGWWNNRAGVILTVGGTVLAVAVAIAWLEGSGCGLFSGRQAAWRPGYNWDGVVMLVGGIVQAVAV